MKYPQALLFLLAFVTTIHAFALPASLNTYTDSTSELFKRKGGGGGGGRGGGGGGSRSSSSSSSGGRTSTPSYSGSPRGYGGGSYYGGGAATPYRPGTARGGVSPLLIGGGAAFLLFPALAYGAYAYSYPGTYRYYNQTSEEEENRPVNCYCAQNSDSCGCDANNSTDYLNAVANNASVAQVLPNGTLAIDGTLQNGTTVAQGNTASGLQQGLYEMSGFWMVIAGVAYTMWFM